MSHSFTYSGRARRTEFWWFVLFLQIVGLVVAMVFAMLVGAAFGSGSLVRGPGHGATGDEVLQFTLVLAASLRCRDSSPL